VLAYAVYLRTMILGARVRGIKFAPVSGAHAGPTRWCRFERLQSKAS